MKHGIFLIWGIGWALSSAAQPTVKIADSIQHLKTIELTDYQLKEFSLGQHIYRFDTGDLMHSRPFLTDLLTYYTPVFFKENGLGMVASPSFRGTTAAQTAVLWNGININSHLNGQTDFNLINIRSAGKVEVRAGGGSLVYGSGAIGGTVHLSSRPEFKKQFTNMLFTGYGSFQTLDNQYQLRVANQKWSLQLTGVHHSSDNDYQLPKQKIKNKNGRFRNYGVNVDMGFRADQNNRLYWYNQFYAGNRHFPVFYDTETPTKYKDINRRSLLEWQSIFGLFQSDLKAAFLQEEYQYYPDIQQSGHTYGKNRTWLGKYDLRFKPAERMLINALVDYEQNSGEGSDIQPDKRYLFSVGLLFKHQLLQKLRYQAGIRHEMASAYGNPFLFDVGVEYDAAGFYTLMWSASKNFRRPSLNDLYWTGSGNPDLKAEKSRQVELGNRFVFRHTKITLTGYFNDIRDMIHWVPASNGLFRPENRDHIQTYGAEALLNWCRSFDHQEIGLTATYAYTVSEDKKSHKQLIYVPYHKATAGIDYRIKQIRFTYELLYNGSVFLRTDNNPQYKLPGYWISNIGWVHSWPPGERFQWGGKIRNLFDKAYESTERYEMPGINFNIFINFNF